MALSRDKAHSEFQNLSAVRENSTLAHTYR